MSQDRTVQNFNTRRKRKAAVTTAVLWLSSVREAERQALDNTPENFQSTDSYESGELAVDALDEVINMLEDVY